jgi:hypothetical protein
VGALDVAAPLPAAAVDAAALTPVLAVVLIPPLPACAPAAVAVISVPLLPLLPPVDVVAIAGTPPEPPHAPSAIKPRDGTNSFMVLAASRRTPRGHCPFISAQPRQ